mgnify:CR=1 FL=1
MSIMEVILLERVNPPGQMGVAVKVKPGSVFHARRVGDAEDLDHNGNVSCPEIGWAGARLFGDYWLR